MKNMIPKNAVDAWRKQVPWNLDGQLEQDLLLSKAILDLYSDPFIQDHLAFRGDTALQKLYFDCPCRYSEGLDFVQVNASPIDIILDHVKSKMDWLGKPTCKVGEGRITLYYKFQPTIDETINLRIKLEINTREHYQLLGITQKDYAIENPWASGMASVTTYHLEELLGTKTRALYQRKKGRDLFDLYHAMRQLNPNPDQIAEAFCFYLVKSGLSVSRANFEENLFNKVTNRSFLNDIYAFVPNEYRTGFEVVDAIRHVHRNLITLLPGEPWESDLEAHLSSLMG